MQISNTALQEKLEWSERSIGELLLEPTVIYVRSVMKLAEKATIKVRLQYCSPVATTPPLSYSGVLHLECDAPAVISGSGASCTPADEKSPLY